MISFNLNTNKNLNTYQFIIKNQIQITSKFIIIIFIFLI